MHLAAVLLLLLPTPISAPADPQASPSRQAVLSRQAVPSWQAPLRTEGRYIVDAHGDRFRLVSGNWHGASGTWTGSGDPADPADNHAGEVSHQIPLGLDRAPIGAILDGFTELGLNSVRLPFSNEMLHDTRPVPDPAVTANPQLRGRTPIQIYDTVVASLTGRGFAVILNNHTTTSRWCCGLDGNERWNTAQSTAAWEDDWLAMARRYAGNPRVVGADLYNEVRRNLLDDPNWGRGDDHDWQAASARVADRILLEANPDLLIFVEGINWYGLPIDGFPHGRPDLTPAAGLSHTLVASDKLVWAAHFYGYTGPNHSGATGTGETTDPRYQDMNPAELASTLYRQAFFVTGDPAAHYTHPVWISEFGVGGRDNTDPKSRAWFAAFVDQLIAHDADFAYWPLVGWHDGGRGNGWALLHWEAAGDRKALDDGDDWRAPHWRRLLAATGRTGPVPAERRWNMLSTDHRDHIASARIRPTGDFDPGARKAVCPDGQRLAGISRTGGRGLCTTADLTWPAGRTYEVVTDQRHVTGDWASGWTKLECAPGSYATGYAVRGRNLSSVLCVPSGRASLGPGDTVWFDRGDNRRGPGGDFATGAYKGQCADNEAVTGIAYRAWIWSPDREPDALLCRDL